MSQLKILVVDDSKIIRKKLGKMIEEFGHQVVAEAENGRQAVSLYREHAPDLVTMDVTMPEMDGIEATRQIIAADPDARILMLTSHAQQEMVENAVDAGVRGFVVKPVKPAKLKDSIAQVAR